MGEVLRGSGKMNGWGLPDWKDKLAYGNTSDWHIYRWRWEFYRRREDYRADFEVSAPETYKYWEKIHQESAQFGLSEPVRTLRPDEPGFGAHPLDDDFKYGYLRLLNPRFSYESVHDLYPTMARGLVSIVQGSGRRYFDPGLKVGAGEGEALLKFDLDSPIEAQLKTAKDMLIAYQKLRHGKALQSRKHVKLWLSYLRVLDGREMGASWQEIFDVVLRSSKTNNLNPVPEARGVWESARHLMFNWPD